MSPKQEMLQYYILSYLKKTKNKKYSARKKNGKPIE